MIVYALTIFAVCFFSQYLAEKAEEKVQDIQKDIVRIILCCYFFCYVFFLNKVCKLLKLLLFLPNIIS